MAADHAATPAGQRELEALRETARADGDVNVEAAATAALRVGAERRAAYRQARRDIAEHRARLRATGLKDDTYWAAEMLDCIYSADAIIDRGEQVFFDPENPVEMAAARQHIIDLDSAADRASQTFKDAHPDIPWTALAKTRDRNAHHYDNLNRDLVWNVLVVEFPKIRKVLRGHLNV